MKVIVSLFDDSGNLFDDWAAQGVLVICVDITPVAGRRQEDWLVHMQRDLSAPLLPEDLPPGCDIVFASAHPPCDHLAVSGSRWFKGKGLRKLAQGVSCFATAAEFCEAAGAPYMIENPVSTISTYWRKPDYVYSPWEYSSHCPEDYYTKTTCLWVGGGFVMPPPAYDAERYARGREQRAAVLARHGRKRGAKEVQNEQPDHPDSRISNAGGHLKSYFRSVTPKGFGRAVFLSNWSNKCTPSTP